MLRQYIYVKYENCVEKLQIGEKRNLGILLPKLFWPTLRKKCFSDREKLLKFETEGQEFAKLLRLLEQFIQRVKGQNNFWKLNAFLTCSWRFLILYKSDQLEFKLEILFGFRNIKKKLENVFTIQYSYLTIMYCHANENTIFLDMNVA